MVVLSNTIDPLRLPGVGRGMRRGKNKKDNKKVYEEKKTSSFVSPERRSGELYTALHSASRGIMNIHQIPKVNIHIHTHSHINSLRSDTRGRIETGYGRGPREENIIIGKKKKLYI